MQAGRLRPSFAWWNFASISSISIQLHGSISRINQWGGSMLGWRTILGMRTGTRNTEQLWTLRNTEQLSGTKSTPGHCQSSVSLNFKLHRNHPHDKRDGLLNIILIFYINDHLVTFVDGWWVYYLTPKVHIDNFLHKNL